jgi:hypothetical protein
VTDDELRQLFEKQNEDLRGYIDANTADLRGYIDANTTDLRGYIDGNTADLRVYIDGNTADVRGYIDARTSDLHLHFDTAAERIEGKVGLLAEGLAHLDQKLDRTAADLRREMREGFDDTHALIRFTYSELYRRLRTLE